MIIIGLIYILDDESYMKFLKKGPLKYIPEMFLPKVMPRVVEPIVREENIVGKVVGINLKPIDFEKEVHFKEYLYSINKLKDDNSRYLFIEEKEKLSDKVKKQIEVATNLKLVYGEDIRINHLFSVMAEIFHVLKEKLEEKEILIICDDKEKIKRIVGKISKGTRFITIIGCEKEQEEIYEYVLEETGISLFFPSNISKVLETYDIIINLIDTMELGLSNINRHCIVFDFGNIDGLSKRKRAPFIDDFAFDLKDLSIEESEFVKGKINSDLGEALMGSGVRDVRYLYVEGKYYTIKDYIDLFIKVRVRGKI